MKRASGPKARRLLDVGSPFEPVQFDVRGTLQEGQSAGFLAAALASPADFVGVRMAAMERRNRQEAGRSRRDFLSSKGPFELQMQG